MDQTSSARGDDIGIKGSTSRWRKKSSNPLPDDPPGDTDAGGVSTLIGQPPAPLLNGAASRQSSRTADKPPRISKRRKAKSYLRRFKSLSFRHTWLIPLLLTLLILCLYAVNPKPSNPAHALIFLSYPLPPNDSLIPASQPSTHPHWPQKPVYYGKGPRDFAFFAFYTLVLSFTREFLMQRLIRPIVLRTSIRSRAKQARFLEQAYTAIYFIVFGPFGLYVMSRTPIWYFKTSAMFEDFPHKSHEGLFKAYYLLQASYWAQQAIVLLLQLEKPRKDFKELVAHHVITLALIGLSYRFHFTYMGLAVYITHDISDFFLATSKVLNYISHPLTGPYYTFFILVWAYGRHYQNLRVLAATLTEFRSVGPFDLNWETQQYKCWISQYITFALLASLQAVNVFWFWLILRIAWKIAIYNVKEDERSQYGSEDAEAGGDASDVKVKGGTTEEKRRRYGIETPPEAKRQQRPDVLVNGAPPESADDTHMLNLQRSRSQSRDEKGEPMTERKKSLRRRA